MTRTHPASADGDTAGSSAAQTSAAQTLAAAVAHLRERQDAQGWWKGELQTNVTMDAEDLLLRWFPLNVYDWGCWARQTIVPLTIVCTLRPVRPLPFGVDELRTGPASLRGEATPRPLWTWGGFFQRTDRILHAYARRPMRLLRRAAMRRSTEWIL